MAKQQDVTIRIKVVNSDAIANTKKQEKAQKDLAKSTEVLSAKMSTARQANLGLNRVVQDSPFFFQSFNMGVMATANNIPFLVESFARLQAETKSTKETMKTFLSTFTGASGILTLISLAVSGILAYTIATRDSKEETDNLSDSWVDALINIEDYRLEIDKLNKSLSRMTELELTAVQTNTFKELSKLNKELREVNSEIDKYKEVLTAMGGANEDNVLATADWTRKLEEAEKKQDELTKEVIKYEDVMDTITTKLFLFGRTADSVQVELAELNARINSLADNDPLKASLIETRDTMEKYLKTLRGVEEKQPRKLKDPFDIKTFAEFRKEIDGFIAKRDEYVKGSFDWLQANEHVKQSMEELIDATLKITGADKALAAIEKFQEMITKTNIFGARARQKAIRDAQKKAEKERLAELRESLMAQQRLTQQFAATIGSSLSSMWRGFLDEGKIRFDDFLNHILAGFMSIATQKLALNIATDIAGGGIPILSDIFDWLLPKTGVTTSNLNNMSDMRDYARSNAVTPSTPIGGTSMQKVVLQIGEGVAIEGLAKIQPSVNNKVKKVTRVFS